jgi:clan AA aspartic protease
MITGVVNADREALIRLEVRGPALQVEVVDAVIDTGCDGWLTLPLALIGRLGLAWQRRGRALRADGTDSIFDIYDGTVIWDGQPRLIAVDEADTVPLVGMALLDGFELIVEVRTSGQVTIRALPRWRAGCYSRIVPPPAPSPCLVLSNTNLSKLATILFRRHPRKVWRRPRG